MLDRTNITTPHPCGHLDYRERDKHDSKIQKHPTTQLQIERKLREGQQFWIFWNSPDLTNNKMIFGLGEQSQQVNHESLAIFQPWRSWISCKPQSHISSPNMNDLPKLIAFYIKRILDYRKCLVLLFCYRSDLISENIKRKTFSST